MALTFEKKSPEPTLGFQKKEPKYAPRGGGAAIALSKKNKAPVAEYAPGIAGFENAADASMFATKFGLTDTLNGAIQLIPGDWGEANMERDWKRLEYAMEQYGAPVVGAYFAGLIADPIGLAIPISKLRIPGKIMKLGEKYLKAKDYAQVAAGSAAVGALGYTPGEVGSEDWVKQKALQAGIGGVAGPALLGGGRAIQKGWQGGKNARWGQNRAPVDPLVGKGTIQGPVIPQRDAVWNKTLGEAAWDKYSNSPTAIGATLGAAGGGFAGYQSGLFEDFGDTTLREWYGDDEPRDWQKWVNGVGGLLLGGAGMRRVFQRKAVVGDEAYNPNKSTLVPDERVARFVIPGYGQTDSYKSAKFRKRGEERMTMEAKVLPVADKISKLSKDDRELLWKMMTQDEGLLEPLKVSKVAPTDEDIAKLEPLKEEARKVIQELGRELVDAGFLSEKIWLKNKDKYLHRLYSRPDQANAAAAGGGFGMIANEFKSRGRVQEVDFDDWASGAYLHSRVIPGKDGRPDASVGKGPKNDEDYKWEAWIDDETGALATHRAWQEERDTWIYENSKFIDELYQDAFELERRIQRASPLTDRDKGRIRQAVIEKVLPENLKKTNQPVKTVKIRRDWTKEERVAMGENTDALDTFLATGRLLAYDGATARMLKHLAVTDSSRFKTSKHGTRISDTPENRLRYGPLAGKYVSDDLLYDMQHFNGDKGINKRTNNKLFRIYRKFNAWWKGTKTVGNPAVHFGNFVSNIMQYDNAMAGMGMAKWEYVGKAMKEVNAFADGAGKVGLREGSDLNEALKRGLLDATLVSGELSEEGLIAVRRLLAREQTMWQGLKDSDVSLVRNASRLTQKIWDKTGGVTIRKASNLYQYEDNVFRYALFLAERDRLMKMGLDKSSAMDAAVRKGRSWFVDYADVPPALGWMRELPLPFLSYTYGIVPRLVETAMKHPMKIAKWGAIGHLANEAGWTLSDDSDREEIERLMEAQSIGYDSMWGIPGTSPTKIKVPDALSEGGFWDISRIYAGGNLFDAKEGGVGQIEILPGFLQPSFGMAGAAGYTMMGIDQFTGREIPNDQKIDAFIRQVVPNTIITPGSYSNIKLKRSLSGKDGPTIDVHTPLAALAAGFGIKVVPADEKKLSFRSASKMKNELRELKSKIKSSARKYENGDYHTFASKIAGKDQKERDKIAKARMAKDIEKHARAIERLVKKYNRDVEGK